MGVDFWKEVARQWSHGIDMKEYEAERRVASIIASYTSNIPDELYEDRYDDDDDW